MPSDIDNDPDFAHKLTTYWLTHFLAAPYCTLCGNSGIIDTSESAKDPHGNPVGVRTYCICPNGLVLRKHKGKIDPDTIIEARKKRSEE